jgi:mRNA-degrading endonuclease RelE of RelBE toxin-antitoxin system
VAKTIEFSETFKKLYKKLPGHIQDKINKQLCFLVANIRHPSLAVHQIEGTGGIWEAYVDDSYRFTFEILKDRYFLRVVGAHEIIDLEAKHRAR